MIVFMLSSSFLYLFDQATRLNSQSQGDISETAVLNRNANFVLDWLHTQLSAWDQVTLFTITDTGAQVMSMVMVWRSNSLKGLN